MSRSLVVSLVLLLYASTAGAQHAAFRITNLELRDPHTYADIFLFGCTDITDDAPLGAPSFNESLDDAMIDDDNLDGFLDLSPMIVFLDAQVAVGTGPDPGNDVGTSLPETGEVATHFGLCTFPASGTTCEPDPENPIQRTPYTTVADSCLAPFPGTTGSYVPPVTSPGPPCFITEPFALLLDLAGLPVTLESAQVSGTLVGDPPSLIVDGLIAGFMPEAVADTVLIPENVNSVGGDPLSSILPGGTECCAGHDDRDLGPDGITPGWWAYLNFEAEIVPLAVATSVLGPVTPATSVPSVRLGRPIPNPFRTETTLSFVLPRDDQVSLTVVDAAGRRVRTLRSGALPSGAHTVAWNGTDANGRLVASGVYFVRLESSLGGRTRKVVFTR